MRAMMKILRMKATLKTFEHAPNSAGEARDFVCVCVCCVCLLAEVELRSMLSSLDLCGRIV